jgi:SAM-dependent methyltransferase
MNAETGAAAFYDDLAATYDLIYADWDASVTRQARSLGSVLTDADVPAAAAVLDCACGMGTQTLGLAARGRRVTGTDLSALAVARARDEAKRRNAPVELAVADMRALPFPDGSFAAVVAADNSLPHLVTPEDLARGLAETLRVLQPRGVLLASTRNYDFARRERPVSAAPSVRNTQTARVITFQLWHWHDDGERYDLEHFQIAEEGASWSVARRRVSYWALTRAELDGALAAAGFSEVIWREPEETGFFQPLVLARRG